MDGDLQLPLRAADMPSSRARPCPDDRLDSGGAEAGDGVSCATGSHDRGEVMDYLRRMQTERPLLFWAAMAWAIWLGFQLVLFVVGLILGPFGLPAWVPIAVVLGLLVLIARRQQR